MSPPQPSIILNNSGFSEEFLPVDVLGRESQIETLRTCIMPATQGRKPFHAWLHGKPGTGKSTVARYVLSQFSSSARLEVACVNCWQHPSLFLVLQRIVDMLRIVVPDNANSTVKLHRIKSKLGQTPLVVILDEFDKAPPKEQNAVLYTLSQLDNVGILAICYSRQHLLSLESRVRSRFNPILVGFDPYGPEELRRILETRAKQCLSSGSVSSDHMDLIVSIAAGDARIAIQTLRAAAQYAEANSEHAITSEHIERSSTDTRKLRAHYALQRLTSHHRLLYEIVQGAGDITSGLLWAAYLLQCKELGFRSIANRTFNVYVNTLVSQNLLQRERAAMPGQVFVLRPSM